MARLTVYCLSALGVAALCAVIVAAWEWRCSSLVSAPIARTENGSTSGSPVSLAQAPDASRKPDSATDEPSEPPYQKFLVSYGRVQLAGFTKPANDGVRVGYCRSYVPGEMIPPGEHTFYAWKGVTVHGAQIPDSSWFPREEFVDIGRLKVVEVDPPLFYMPISGDLYAPGYYRHTPANTTFFRWIGVNLKREQIPDDARSKRLLTEKSAYYTIDIDPPKHVVDRPELWKKE